MATLLRSLTIAPLALALMLPATSRPQPPVPFVAVDASILAGPLLLLVIPLALHLSRSDEKRVREFEARDDWPGLASFASSRIEQHPGDTHWLELRGRALQRQGRCRDAMPDLSTAFESHLTAPSATKATYAAGWALGMCQMALPDLVAAATTFERLQQLDPSQPEPAYNLGVIRTIQGDTAAAAAAAASLTSRNASLGESLRAYMVAAAAQPAAGTSSFATNRIPIAQGLLGIGGRALQLPGGDWYLASRSQSSVRGGTMRSASARTQLISVLSLQAFALAQDGSFVAAAEFTANPQQAYGVAYWNADDGCAVRNVLHLKRFRADFDQPECVYLRMISPAAEARWQPLLQGWGGPPPGLAYEVHYERYGTGWLVTSTFLLPVTSITGDFAATQWAHSLAAQLRPLARSNHPAAALVPALVTCNR